MPISVTEQFMKKDVERIVQKLAAHAYADNAFMDIMLGSLPKGVSNVKR